MENIITNAADAGQWQKISDQLATEWKHSVKLSQDFLDRKNLQQKIKSSVTAAVYRPLVKQKINEYLRTKTMVMWSMDEENCRLRSDLGLDSLDWCSLYVYLEEYFNVTLPPYTPSEDIMIKTLTDDLICCLQKK